MSLQNKFYDAPEPDKVVFEVVFSEKEGGGTVDVTDLEGDLPAGSVVGLATGNIYKPIKGATLVKAIGAEDTTIEIAKGSGFKQGEFIAFGGKAVAISAINSSGCLERRADDRSIRRDRRRGHEGLSGESGKGIGRGGCLRTGLSDGRQARRRHGKQLRAPRQRCERPGRDDQHRPRNSRKSQIH